MIDRAVWISDNFHGGGRRIGRDDGGLVRGIAATEQRNAVDIPSAAGGVGVGGDAPSESQIIPGVFGGIGEVDDGFHKAGGIARPSAEAVEFALDAEFSGSFNGDVITITCEDGTGTERLHVEPWAVVDGEFQFPRVLGALQAAVLPELELKVGRARRDADGG